MGCGCSKRAGSANRPGPAAKAYVATLHTGEVLGPFLTAIEAKAAVRKGGGGTVRGVKAE